MLFRFMQNTSNTLQSCRFATLYGQMLCKVLLVFCALSCVGHPADDEDDIIDDGGTTVVTDAAPGIVFDFTATWCVNCPRMTAAIEEASAEAPGQLYPVCIHFHDALASTQTEAIATYYGIESYPSAVVNLESSTLMTATSKDLIVARLKSTAEGRTAPCSIGLEYYDGKLSVTVTPESAGNYSLAVLVLEDGIVAPQTGGSDSYIHDNVLRKVLSASVLGDDLGAVGAGTPVTRDFMTELSSSMHALAYVLDAKGKLNATCHLTL